MASGIYGHTSAYACSGAQEKGWIKPELDPRGWFHWYSRYYRGRRTDDDERQIKRWRGVAGEKGRWKRALVNRVLAANKCCHSPSLARLCIDQEDICCLGTAENVEM